MDQHEHRPGEEPRDNRAWERQGAGGSANTPTFGAEHPPVDNADSEAGSGSPDGSRSSSDDRTTRDVQRATNRISQHTSRPESGFREPTASFASEREPLSDGARSLRGGMESVADHLRGSDLEGLKGELERQVREKPLQTLLLSLAAGWLFGKLVR